MKNLILILTLLVFSNVALAVEWQSETFCWQKPTERVNGTALAVESIIEYEVWYNEEDHGLDWEHKWTVPSTQGCVTYKPQGIGGEVCVNNFVVGTDNAGIKESLKSGKSNTVCRFPKLVPVISSPPKPAVMLP